MRPHHEISTRLHSFFTPQHFFAIFVAVLFLCFSGGIIFLGVAVWWTGGFAWWSATIVTFLCLFGWAVSMGMADQAWRSIPSVLYLRSPGDLKRLGFEGNYLLVLWATRVYEDRVGTVKLGYSKDAGEEISGPVSGDSQMVSLAEKHRLDTLRFCASGERPVVGVDPKSRHVICRESLEWKKIVKVAMEQSRAIVLYPGPGEGIKWEQNVIRSCAGLREKCVFFEGDINRVLNQIDLLLEKLKPTNNA